MSANSTAGANNLPLYTLYSVQGLIISGSNLFIVLSILRHEALRTNKEYLLMLGLSLADSCFMAGFLVAGIYRISLVLSGQHDGLLTAWQCAIKPHNLLLILGAPWANLMLFVVSLDRMFCVSKPLRYIGMTRTYSYSILFPTFLLALAYASMYVAVPLFLGSDDKILRAPCITYAVMSLVPKWASTLYTSVPSSVAFLSVIVYIGVWYKHLKHSQVANVGDHQGNTTDELKRQRKITSTLAMSCFLTFLLFCIPMMLANLLLLLGYGGMTFLFFYLLSTLNPLCNVFIYQIRHKEMRVALKKLFSFEKMPLDIKMWTNVGNRTSTRRRSRKTTNNTGV